MVSGPPGGETGSRRGRRPGRGARHSRTQGRIDRLAMAKPLRVAGEVDSFCTKCRLVLNHRIVSMKAGKAYQVECLTCRTTHLWRQHAPGEKAAPSPGGARTARTSPAPGPRSARISPA